jgi:hypothetical protein
MKTMELRPCNRRGTLAVAFTRTMFGIFVALVMALISVGAHAQSPRDLEDSTPPPTPDAAAEVAEPSVAAGPTIYVTDSAGRLATVTLGTYAVHIIGSEGVKLTDIAFNPKDGQLYGVSYTNFYIVNRTTGKATLIGSLDIPGKQATALVFNGQGVAITAAFNSPYLYTINIKTGHVTLVASTTSFASAGDLTFYNGYLVESGYLLGTLDPYLVFLNPTTGKLELYAELNNPPLPNLLGLACTGKDKLYGFAGTSVYQFVITLKNGIPTTLTTVQLASLAGKGLAEIWGAAYDGYFLY